MLIVPIEISLRSWSVSSRRTEKSMRFSATRWHTRTCRAFRASRQFAASRPPTHLTLSSLDRQDRKSTTRADLLQRPQWCCMSG